MNEINRFRVPIATSSEVDQTYADVVLASDFDVLRAENAKLREALESVRSDLCWWLDRNETGLLADTLKSVNEALKETKP